MAGDAPNGRLGPLPPSSLARRPRRAAGGQRQSLWISVVSAAAGLAVAWLLFGGGSGEPPPPLEAAGSAHEPRLPGGLDHQPSRAEAAGQRQGHQTWAEVVRQATEQDLQQALARAAAGGTAPAARKEQPQQQDPPQQPQQQDQQQQQQQPALPTPGMQDEREWFGKLSAEGCRQAHAMRVCSHRGQLAVEGVAPGSLTAYSVLFKAGVSCFDIDFTLTADGQLLATHPDDLASALAPALPGGAGRIPELSLAELRAAGADEERFPTAEALIKVFAHLLEQGGLLWKRKGRPPYADLPVLLMDLKGAAYNVETIGAVADVAEAVGAVPHVALFVSTAGQLALAQGEEARWRGPLIRAFMDRDDPNPPVSADALAPYALLGPSIRMADAFLAAAVQLGKPALCWTVDAPRELHRGLELGVNAVVSNNPLALRAVLMDWRDRCSERQRRALRRAAAGRHPAAAAAGAGAH